MVKLNAIVDQSTLCNILIHKKAVFESTQTLSYCLLGRWFHAQDIIIFQEGSIGGYEK